MLADLKQYTLPFCLNSDLVNSGTHERVAASVICSEKPRGACLSLHTNYTHINKFASTSLKRLMYPNQHRLHSKPLDIKRNCNTHPSMILFASNYASYGCSTPTSATMVLFATLAPTVTAGTSHRTQRYDVIMSLARMFFT